MKLSNIDLTSREFLMYFYLIQEEFGNTIPWLSKLNNFSYITDKNYFEEMFREKTIGFDYDIKPYMYYENTLGNNISGGIIHFEKSPEKFKESFNKKLLEELEDNENFSYISCFLLRSEYRRNFHGIQMFTNTLKILLKEHKNLWGVVSESKLLNYYKQFGFEVRNKLSKEGFYIITLKNEDFKKSIILT